MKIWLPLVVGLGCLLAPKADAASLLSANQNAVLQAWLKQNPHFRLATDEDCDCAEDIDEMRKSGPWGQPIPDFKPYVLVGDFRGDGNVDFAVVVMEASSGKKDSGAIVIFDGPTAHHKNVQPVFVGKIEIGPIRGAALFASPRGGFPVFGAFSSEGCAYQPKQRTYVENCDGF